MDIPESVKKKNPLAEDGEPMWCGGCGAYNGNKVAGGCRRGAPIPFIVGVGQDMLGRQQPILNSYWPSVGTADWCFSFVRASTERVLEEPPQAVPAKKSDAIIIPDGGRA